MSGRFPTDSEPKHGSWGGLSLRTKLCAGSIGSLWEAERSRKQQSPLRVLLRRYSVLSRPPRKVIQHIANAAKAIMALEHPRVLRVIDIIVVGNEIGIVSEHLEGMPLTELMSLARRKQTALPQGVVLRMLLDLLDGLAATHEHFASNPKRQHAYGSVCPDCVLVSTDGHTRLMEAGLWGIAGIDAAWEKHLNRVAYCAPEQLEVVPKSTVQTDVFSLGALGWELFKNQPLFFDKDYGSVSANIREKKIKPLDPRKGLLGSPPKLGLGTVGNLPPPPGMASASLPVPPPQPAGTQGFPKPLIDALGRALDRNPSGRFESAREMAAALRNTTIPVATATAVQHAFDNFRSGDKPAASAGALQSPRFKHTARFGRPIMRSNADQRLSSLAVPDDFGSPAQAPEPSANRESAADWPAADLDSQELDALSWQEEFFDSQIPTIAGGKVPIPQLDDDNDEVGWKDTRPDGGDGPGTDVQAAASTTPAVSSIPFKGTPTAPHLRAPLEELNPDLKATPIYKGASTIPSGPPQGSGPHIAQSRPRGFATEQDSFWTLPKDAVSDNKATKPNPVSREDVSRGDSLSWSPPPPAPPRARGQKLSWSTPPPPPGEDNAELSIEVSEGYGESEAPSDSATPYDDDSQVLAFRVPTADDAKDEAGFRGSVQSATGIPTRDGAKGHAAVPPPPLDPQQQPTSVPRAPRVTVARAAKRARLARPIMTRSQPPISTIPPPLDKPSPPPADPLIASYPPKLDEGKPGRITQTEEELFELLRDEILSWEAHSLSTNAPPAGGKNLGSAPRQKPQKPPPLPKKLGSLGSKGPSAARVRPAAQPSGPDNSPPRDTPPGVRAAQTILGIAKPSLDNSSNPKPKDAATRLGIAPAKSAAPAKAKDPSPPTLHKAPARPEDDPVPSSPPSLLSSPSKASAVDEKPRRAPPSFLAGVKTKTKTSNRPQKKPKRPGVAAKSFTKVKPATAKANKAAKTSEAPASKPKKAPPKSRKSIRAHTAGKPKYNESPRPDPVIELNTGPIAAVDDEPEDPTEVFSRDDAELDTPTRQLKIPKTAATENFDADEDITRPMTTEELMEALEDLPDDASDTERQALVDRIRISLGYVPRARNEADSITLPHQLGKTRQRADSVTQIQGHRPPQIDSNPSLSYAPTPRMVRRVTVSSEPLDSLELLEISPMDQHPGTPDAAAGVPQLGTVPSLLASSPISQWPQAQEQFTSSSPPPLSHASPLSAATRRSLEPSLPTDLYALPERLKDWAVDQFIADRKKHRRIVTAVVVGSALSLLFALIVALVSTSGEPSIETTTPPPPSINTHATTITRAPPPSTQSTTSPRSTRSIRRTSNSTTTATPTKTLSPATSTVDYYPWTL